MSTEEEMTINERRKYLHRMQSRYRTANRQERGQLLDEMEIVTGLHRKSLIRLMGGSLARKRRQRQRDRVYGADVDAALRVIDESLDYICAERLTPALVETAKQLVRHGELETNDALLAQLAQISVSTVKRRLATLRTNVARPSRRGGAKRASSLMQRIPTRRIPWDESAPGHLELDLVWHCGDSASGEFVCTLQMIDVATTWSERVGILGRSFLVVQDAYRRILNRLPFRVREIHPDNGSEFINNHSWRFWKGAVQGVRFSRSRPYQKNDNRMVEQKHSPLVRAYLGYDRLDTVAQTVLLNRLYDKAWWHYNFFQPVLRLEAKTLIRDDQGQLLRIQRRFDRARTPFERLCETDAIEPAHHHRLARQRDRINPRRLRQEIYDLIDQIFALPGAVANVSENVFQTLLFHPQSEMPQTERQKALRLDFNCTPLQPAQKDVLDET
jgi:predicted nucleic acid-binding protein